MNENDIRERLCTAMRLPLDTPDWVERAERMLHGYLNWKERRQLKPLDLSTVPGRVRFAREAMGLTQAHLAARIGVRKYQVWGWEHGTQDIPAEKFPGLCMSTGVSQSWMLGESEDGGPPSVPQEVIRTALSPSYLAYRRERKTLQMDREKARKALAEIQAEVEALKSKRP